MPRSDFEFRQTFVQVFVLKYPKMDFPLSMTAGSQTLSQKQALFLPF
jgi:hypothetical protein